MTARTSIRLSDLSDDVLRLIFYRNVSFDDLKSLRLAHPGFHGSVDPLLFKSISIAAPVYLELMPHYLYPHDLRRRIWHPEYQSFPESKDPSFKASEYQISCILERKVPAVLSDNVQDITVKRYDIFEGYPDEAKMKSAFPQYSQEGIEGMEYFLCSMKKLHTLTWAIPCSNISQVMNLSPLAERLKSLRLGTAQFTTSAPPTQLSYKAFNVFTSLTSLDIHYYESADIRDLSYFPNLRTLVFTFQHTPQTDPAKRRSGFVDFLEAQRVPFSLRMLSLSAHYPSTPIPENLAEKFLSNLDTLQLWNFTPGTKGYPIIDALRENNIRVRNLKIQGCHPDVIEYLSSYTDTLQSLEVSVQSAKDAEGLGEYEEEDAWGYTGSRRRWQEDIIEQKKAAFKADIWARVVSAHKNSLEHLVLGDNYRISADDKEILYQCKALKTMNIKADDWVLNTSVPLATRLPSLELLEFEIPWTLRKPNMSGWCGTATIDWHMKPKDITSRVKSMKWMETAIEVDAQTAERVCFRVSGIQTDLKLVRVRNKFYPWILVGDGEMGIEGRERGDDYGAIWTDDEEIEDEDPDV
ncbi:hypothetical protein TWF481_004521 [Arthrobotrys musiformis]|uniref:F-box domain-containing protein n=1 Tax=Arthrobotrys musiformis TaxID=47236 RepID=A0AAV9WLW7_9PEZI